MPISMETFRRKKVHAEARRRGYTLVPGSGIVTHSVTDALYGIHIVEKNGRLRWVNITVESLKPGRRRA